MTHHKKFYLFLLAAIALFSVAIYFQINKARGIVTNYATDPVVNPTATYIPIDQSDPTLGNPGADMWIVLFADLGCARCREANYAITNYIRNNPEKARLIWKDSPRTSLLSWGNLPAHLAAQCANEQGQFWKFVEITMSDKNNLKEAGLAKTAQSLGLDLGRWNTCRTATSTQMKVATSMGLAKALGVTDLPGLFVNNKKINLKNDMNIGELINSFATKPQQ